MDIGLPPNMFRSQILPPSKSDSDPVIQSSQFHRSASNDDLGAAADATHSIFSFLTATAKAKSIRVDEFDGDADEDNFDVDETDMDEEDDEDEEGLVDDKELELVDTDRSQLSSSLSQASENLHKTTSRLSHATADTQQEDVVDKQKSVGDEDNSEKGDETKGKMAVQVEQQQQQLKSWPIGTNLSESVHSLKKVPTRSETSRANALTDKLKSQLGIDEDDQLLGGKFSMDERL
jgi:hypothetical protein